MNDWPLLQCNKNRVTAEERKIWHLLVRRLEGNWFACNARTAGCTPPCHQSLAPSGDRRNCVRGDEVSFVAEELKGIFDPRGGQWSDGGCVPSDAPPRCSWPGGVVKEGANQPTAAVATSGS